MRTVKRPRRYLDENWIALLRPLFRYSEHRDAYVLRVVGRQRGPVLKVERRHGGPLFAGPERRGARPV